MWGSQNGSGWGLYGTSVTGYGAYVTASSAGGRGFTLVVALEPTRI
ncbi:MAG: hypothetical protein M5U34_49225 [Chloroflexi bacterium]|nr:hypothetical protein [Chloroflexota bacterium]